MTALDYSLVTPQYSLLIENYVRQHIKPTFASRYKEFIPLVAKKIDERCKEIFRAIKSCPTFCLERTYSFDLEPV
ncbi:hypothetical protein [Parachlamydia acanthamoebae]|uniref:Uncharacterized protein n=1 Tax=Parachlamydia acanthamoebae TaxID=83552 RepID=A0A0C1E5Z3_9BACT|nr:hypothetical protein [Parachlamydia acanthamoebae]KIA76722.1 hypothetical protein DB43_HL00310 [Parachlamydia acanthamoebae]